MCSSPKNSTALSYIFLKLGERYEKLLVHVLLPKELDSSFVYLPSTVNKAMSLLKLGKPDPVFSLGMDHDKPLVDKPGPVQLFVPKLKLDVGEPGLLLGLPLHPPLEH